MVQKIKRQSGYPTTDGQLFDKYVDAIKHQSEVDLKKAAVDAGSEMGHQKFIEKHPEIVADYIKYNCKKVSKPKSQARKPASSET